jgi:hypothetical protein
LDFKIATVLLLISKIFKDKEAKFKKLTTLRDHIYGLPEVRKIPAEGGKDPHPTLLQDQAGVICGCRTTDLFRLLFEIRCVLIRKISNIQLPEVKEERLPFHFLSHPFY